MSLIEEEPGVVHSIGPAILLPEEVIGNVITKTNILITSHRRFLAELPRHDADSTSPASSVITTPPSLNPRYPRPLPQIVGVLPECSSAVSSASNVGAASVASLSSSLESISSTLAQSIASLQSVVQASNAAVSSANNARLSIQSSASIALSSANSTASSALLGSSRATSALSSLSSSASAAISSIQASAGAAIATAQSSVLSVNNALSSIQSSANLQAISLNSAVASANAAANAAQATATFAIAQAQASVSSLSAQAYAKIAASRTAAMNTTKFALAITFAILGSSILSILAYYLIARYRQRKREARQLALKEKINRVRHNSDDSQGGPSLSEFPMPVGRDTWSRGMSMDERRTWTRNGPDTRATGSTDMQMPIQGGTPGRKTWANTPNTPRTPGRPSSAFPFASGGRANTWSGKDGSRTVTANGMDEDGNTDLGAREIERPTMVRKNTLTYDPEHPERPPKFTTWLEDSFRSVSPFPRIGGVNTAQPEIRQTMARRSEAGAGGGIGTAI